MTTQPATFGRKPTYRLYRVIGACKSAIWTPIGPAWPNKDGMGFNVSYFSCRCKVASSGARFTQCMTGGMSLVAEWTECLSAGPRKTGFQKFKNFCEGAFCEE